MAIIATKSGWLTLGALVHEDEQSWTVHIRDQKRDRVINKSDTLVQVFQSAHDAEHWVKFNILPADHRGRITGKAS